MRMSERMVFVILLGIAAGFSGCSRRTPVIEVADETLHSARRQAFPYVATLSKAQEGEQDAITQLLRFSSKTDAAASIGHGVVLVELLHRIGDSVFSSSLSSLSLEEAVHVMSVLEAGVAYSKEERYRRPVQAAFPLTARVLESHKERLAFRGELCSPMTRRRTEIRTWPVGHVKLDLRRPTLSIRFLNTQNRLNTLEVWAGNQNDFNVPMVRLSHEDTLWAITEGDFKKLKELP